jgi:putative DNA primase/helicase
MEELIMENYQDEVVSVCTNKKNSLPQDDGRFPIASRKNQIDTNYGEDIVDTKAELERLKQASKNFKTSNDDGHSKNNTRPSQYDGRVLITSRKNHLATFDAEDVVDTKAKNMDFAYSKNPASNFLILNGENRMLDADYNPKHDKKNHMEDFISENTPEKLSKEVLTKVIDDNSKINLNLLTNVILERLEFKVIQGQPYIYDPPIHRIIYDQECKVLIRSMLPENFDAQLTDSNLSEIVRLIKTNPYIQLKLNDIRTRELVFTLKHRLFSIKNNRFVERKENEIYFNRVDIDFDPENIAYGSKFENYLDFCTGNDAVLKNLIYEVIGYIISNSNSAKKFFLLFGVPNSGKSTFGNLLTALIGDENCCHIPLQSLSERFRVAPLHGKKLCVNMDIPDTPIRDTSIIKQLTGNDVLVGENKGQDLFSFRNSCKLLYGCNTIPKVSTHGDEKAFYDRMIIIPFLNEVSRYKKDIKLIEKLLKERNYIVCKAMKAYEGLVENNFEFTWCKSSEDAKRSYMKQENNVKEFVDKCCSLDPDMSEFTTELYESYENFCIDSGFSNKDILSINMFSRSLSSISGIESGRWRDGKKNCRGFKGISLK